MTDLLPQPQGTSAWPASFTAGLHAALRRRIPPQTDAPELEALSRDLVLALEQGELTVALTPERLAAAQASGWLERDASPLLLQGDRLGWRRWLQACNQRRQPSRCLLYTSPSPRDGLLSRMPSSA